MPDRDIMMPSTDAAPITGCLPSFEIRLRIGLEATRPALQDVLCALAPLQLETEERTIVELVLAEALNNIAEHAYAENVEDGPIQINCTHLPDGLHFTLIDQGQAMPDGAAPLGPRPDLNVERDDLPEGGFGWFLIQDLAKDVCYQRTDGENKLSLRLAVAYGRTSH